VFLKLVLKEPPKILQTWRFDIFLQLLPSGFILADNPDYYDCQDRANNNIYPEEYRPKGTIRPQIHRHTPNVGFFTSVIDIGCFGDILEMISWKGYGLKKFQGKVKMRPSCCLILANFGANSYKLAQNHTSRRFFVT
jgi:hypothetical protein